jgi:arylsulfatase A-like enzyme
MSDPSTRPFRSAARWAGASVFAASAGAIALGAMDARQAGDVLELLTITGYCALVAVPLLFVVSALVRALWRAWRPEALAALVLEDDGAAPLLAAWLAYVGVACVALSWATFNAIRLLAATTTFKPTVIAVFTPPFVIAMVLILVALSRPCVRLLCSALRAAGRRARRLVGTNLLTPRWILAGAIVLTLGLTAIGWWFSIRPRVGFVDISWLLPLVGAASVCAIAHPLYQRASRRGRLLALSITAALAAGVMLAAVALRQTRPSVVLTVWSKPTVASELIERFHVIEELRSDVHFEVARPAAKAGSKARDVLLITLDTVRGDRTPMLGGPASMPTLAGLAERGASFTWAFSPGNVTRRSLPTIATGLSPTRIVGKVAGWALKLDPRHIMVAERFRAAGYETAGFFCCESFWGDGPPLGFSRGIDRSVIIRNGAELAEAARAWLAEREQRTDRPPLFVWVHMIDAHNWTEKSSAKAPLERRALYDRVLTTVDHNVGVLLSALAGRAPDEQPIIAVTSDHGEALGDHNTPYHSTDLYNSQIRVPLVIAGPGVKTQRIAEPVGLVDLAPTLMDLAGFVPPSGPEMDGRNLADLLQGSRAPDGNGGYAFAAMIRDRSVAAPAQAIIRGPWKMIETDDSIELYDLTTDPNEHRNLAESQPEKLQELRALMEERKVIDQTSPFMLLK